MFFPGTRVILHDVLLKVLSTGNKERKTKTVMIYFYKDCLHRNYEKTLTLKVNKVTVIQRRI